MTAIRALVADRVRIPFRRPFPTANGMWLERDTLADPRGRRRRPGGLGEACLEPDAAEVADTILVALIREAAETATEGRLPSGADLEMHGAPGRALNAALESARFDLARVRCRRVGCGGRTGDDEGVGVNATIPSLGTKAAAEAALQSVGVRVHDAQAQGRSRARDGRAGRPRPGDPRRDRSRGAGCDSTSTGPGTLPTAEERLEAVARFDLEYCEQPLPSHDIDGLAELRRRVRVPIAADEAAESVRAVRALLDADAVDALVVKPARVGGLVAVAEIAVAAAGGAEVVISTLFETGVGIAAALAAASALPDSTADVQADADADWPPDHGLATAGLLDHDLLLEPLVVEDGRMHAPGDAESGGLGVRLDIRALDRYRVESVGSLP